MPQFSPYRSRKGGETRNSVVYKGSGGRAGRCQSAAWFCGGKIPVLRLLEEFDNLKKADSKPGTAI